MLSILAQDENAVRFCCDEEGREFLLRRLQEVAAGDHAWFVGEELEDGRYEWVSLESRGARELTAQEIDHDGKLTLRIECPADAAAAFCAELRAASATTGGVVEHILRKICKNSCCQ